MDDAKRQAEALLTDHFTYTPLSLIDDIINAVNAIVYHALDALEDGLLAVPPTQLGFKSKDTKGVPGNDNEEVAEAAKDEIENGVHALETLLESTVDRNFDKFEIWTLRNILTVPEDLAGWVRLAHYQDLQFPATGTTPTPESIHLLRRKVAESRKLNRALKAMRDKNKFTTQQLNALTVLPDAANAQGSNSAPLAFISKPAGDASVSQAPLLTQVQFATSHLAALRGLVAALRPRLEQMKSLSVHKVDWESSKEDRRQYIEGAVRRIVTKSGLDSGDIITEPGPSNAANRRGLGEVEELESLVTAVNGQGRQHDAEKMEE